MLWLVRHGESTANLGAIGADFSQVPLTARGRAQAERFAQDCAQRPDAILRSSYLRARQTSDPLVKRYPDVTVMDMSIHEFTYITGARCANIDSATHKALVEDYWLCRDTDYVDGEGAESFTAFVQRARGFLIDAQELPGFTVAFTHGNFIRAIVLLSQYGLDTPPAALMPAFRAMREGLPVANASVTRLRFDAGRWWLGGIDNAFVKSG